MLAHALSLVPEREDVQIRLHPADHAALVADAAVATQAATRSVTLIADASLQPGDAVARCGATEIDARITAGIARVAGGAGPVTSALDRIRTSLDGAVDMARPQLSGEVAEVRGLSVSVHGALCRIGDLVLIGEHRLPAEVVAVNGESAACLPLGPIAGIGTGDRVVATATPA